MQLLPRPDMFAGIQLQAPVIYLKDVFEPEFCRKLVGLYEKHGGTESGFMREVDGKTVHILDHAHKSRADYLIEDAALIKETQLEVPAHMPPMAGGLRSVPRAAGASCRRSRRSCRS